MSRDDQKERASNRPKAKTSAELEREVESTRAGLTATLEDLKDRMSPGKLVDDLFQLATDSAGGEIVNGVGRSVRANPVPVLLIGAGFAWLLASANTSDADGDYETVGGIAMKRGGQRNRSRKELIMDDNGTSPVEWPHASRGVGLVREGHHSDRPVEGSVGVSIGSQVAENTENPGVLESAGVLAADLGAKAASAVGQAASAAYETAADAAAYATSAMAAGRAAGATVVSAGRRAGETTYEFSQTVGGGAYEHGRSAAQHVYSEAEEAWRVGRSGFGRVLEQQPLVLAAIGLAVGAAIGAALPSTQVENQWMGQQSDELKRRAREMAEEQFDNARDVAGQFYEDVRDEIGKQGLGEIPAEIITQVTDRVKTAAENVRATASEGVAGAVDEAKKVITGAEEDVKSYPSTKQGGQSDAVAQSKSTTAPTRKLS
jgi:hypothetical protein